MNKRDLLNRLYGVVGVVMVLLSYVGIKKIIEDIRFNYEWRNQVFEGFNEDIEDESDVDFE